MTSLCVLKLESCSVVGLCAAASVSARAEKALRRLRELKPDSCLILTPAGAVHLDHTGNPHLITGWSISFADEGGPFLLGQKTTLGAPGQAASVMSAFCSRWSLILPRISCPPFLRTIGLRTLLRFSMDRPNAYIHQRRRACCLCQTCGLRHAGQSTAVLRTVPVDSLSAYWSGILRPLRSAPRTRSAGSDRRTRCYGGILALHGR